MITRNLTIAGLLIAAPAMGRCNDVYPQPSKGTVPSYIWPWVLVKKRLRLTNRVSVHDRKDIDGLGWQQKVIIGAIEPVTALA